MPDLVVDIAVGISVHKTFHYRAPGEMQDLLLPGTRVLIPFGSRRVTGTVIGLLSGVASDGLKQVIEVLDDHLSPELLDLARWMSDYYLHPLGLTIETLLPKALGRAVPKMEKMLCLIAGADTAAPKGPKQAALLHLLKEQGETAVSALDGFSRSTIKSLQDAGLLEITERELSLVPVTEAGIRDKPPELMPEQAGAVAEIGASLFSGTFGVYLLHGVTGSGKTEVYLHSIALLSGTGRGAIVLVPEIALTPQLLGRSQRRFGDRVAVLHSGLTDRERADEYRRIRSGGVDVAVGARSAVFAPFAKLGLVIVDEEHENSYKQEEGLRYQARDVAVMRAKLQAAVAVLGSATPSLESFFNAAAGKYRLLRLSARVDHRPMPEVAVIDLKAQPAEGGYAPALQAAIRERTEKKEQTLLLLNRRGFSSVLICRDCGTAIRCPSCSVSLTFHKPEAKLKCHYCDHVTFAPDWCPSCSGINLKLLGTGTQKVEEELQRLFPAAVVVRMDSDSVKGRQAYETLLGQVDRGEVDILLGTQMVAKGHDFPGVTLVGVVDADIGLNLPDFRSAERTFQLITQAAGRAGRGDRPGQVMIQTMNPGHYAVRHSTTHDYEGFYEEEIQYRRELGYPPFRRLVKFEVRSAQEQIASDAARKAFNRMRTMIRGNDPAVLGPAPSPVARVRGRYRFQILLLSERRDLLRRVALEGKSVVEDEYGRACRVVVDVDPVNLM
ncbi:MAG TPA: primosomal protein N' [Nitrospiraceae bacterium]|nr:primosomal protein N' [Nitrospiraceae bacterium]